MTESHTVLISKEQSVDEELCVFVCVVVRTTVEVILLLAKGTFVLHRTLQSSLDLHFRRNKRKMRQKGEQYF